MTTNQHKKKRKRTGKPPAGVLYIREIPLDLKLQFRAHCTKRNLTMRQYIIRHMREVTRQP